MSSQDNKYRHLLRTYYGDIVERGQFDKLHDFFADGYIAHFREKDVDFEGCKELLQTLHKTLRNINVEIESDKWCDDRLCHEILFQANRKDDLSPVEWRSSTKWRIENGKIAESWPNTTISYEKIRSCESEKSAKQEQQGQSQQTAQPQAAK